MVEVRGGEHNSGLLEIAVLAVGRPSDLPAPAIPPGFVLLIEPAAVTEVMHDLAMRAAAGFNTRDRTRGGDRGVVPGRSRASIQWLETVVSANPSPATTPA